MPDETRNLTSRSLCLRAQTANEETRSVQATIATETPVEVYDWWEDTRVLEVLLMSGVRMPDNGQLPMLAVHSRWGLDDVLGSARGLKSEGAELSAYLHFARDDASQKAWEKTRDGHITDVSVGYRVNSSVMVKPGSSAQIAGRTFTADKLPLRVTTDWTLKEVSLVPIGADVRAKIRGEQQAITAYENYRQQLTNNPNQETRNMDEETTRTEPETKVDTKPEAAPAVDQNALRQEAIAAERARVKSLRDLARDDVPAEIVTRAIDEGWDEARASREFLTAVREARKPTQTDVPYHPTAHTGKRDGSARALMCGLISSRGFDPTKHVPHNGSAPAKRSERFTEQDAEQGDDFRSMSTIDIIRACIHADTGRWPLTEDHAFEMLRATPTSGMTLSNVFTTSAYASLVEGWNAVQDTTAGWCEEEDVANFMSHDNITFSATARPKLLPSGATAQHATASDTKESYRAARYALQVVWDEQTTIDDRFGSLAKMAQEMGEGCRALRPELVYSEILANPALADTGTIFNATAVTTTGGHANYSTGGASALGSAALTTGIQTMLAQRIGRTATDPGRVIDTNAPRFLIVPAALDFTARALVQGSVLVKLFADSADPLYNQQNPFARFGLQVVTDDRIGAIGTIDPRTGAVRTGSDTAWYLCAGPRRGLRVVYRRGTNRQPQMRSFVLTQGQWGMGYDINFDLGVKFMDYVPWYKSAGV